MVVPQFRSSHLSAKKRFGGAGTRGGRSEGAILSKAGFFWRAFLGLGLGLGLGLDGFYLGIGLGLDGFNFGIGLGLDGFHLGLGLRQGFNTSFASAHHSRWASGIMFT